MTYKILSLDEYNKLSEDTFGIVSELDEILIENQLVAVELDDDTFKILKYPNQYKNFINDQERFELDIISTRAEIEQFIFLTCF